MRSLILLTILGGLTTAALADSVPRPTPEQKKRPPATAKRKSKVAKTKPVARKTAPAREYFDTKSPAPEAGSAPAKTEMQKVASTRK